MRFLLRLAKPRYAKKQQQQSSSLPQERQMLDRNILCPKSLRHLIQLKIPDKQLKDFCAYGPRLRLGQ